MKLLSVCTFLSCVFSMRSEQCNPDWKSCRNVADIAMIICDTATRAPCTVVNGSLTTPDDEIITGLVVPPFNTIDEELCRKKCQEQANSDSEHKCEYFRWIQDHSETKKTTCSLQTTCEHDTYCDSFDCVSGQLPDCDEDGNKLFPCSLSSPTEWDNSKFHVICTDRFGDVNIYNSTTTEIPAGTVCSTIRLCDAWADITDASETFYRKLAIRCNGTVGIGAGTLEPMPITGSTDLSTAMIVGNTIVEQKCDSTCPELTINIPAEQYWADLICDDPLEEGGILKDGNSCILLCDNHLKMSIDCRFTREGEKQWQDGEGTELTAATIKC